MAKMHFKYASMNSGKSIDLMRSAHNYEENGYKVLVIKPGIDTKAGTKISSRVGLEREVDIVLSNNDLVFDVLKGKLNDISCIFIDESQFLSHKQVDDFFVVSKACNIPVICYGLRNNFKMEAFAGGKRLLEICDILEEIPTLCSCGNIARYVGRMVDGEFVLDGEEVVIDGARNVDYKPLCGDCHLQKVKKIEFTKIRKELNYNENRN